MITFFATLISLAAPQTGLTSTTPTTPAELKEMSDFGACLVSNRSKTGQLLSAVPGSDEERVVMNTLMRTACPRIEEITVDTDVLRDVVAEAAFERDFGSVGAPAKRTPVSLFTAPAADQLPAMPYSVRYSVALIDYATCVVQAGPHQASALFATAPGSAQEASAFAAISPLLGPCLPQGSQATFSRPQLRGALAEAAYRIAAAPK